MLTHFLRLILARSMKPFQFRAVPPETPADRKEGTFLSKHIGLYIHIPFCESICDFCPYFKELYDAEKMELYVSALLKELEYRKASLPAEYSLSSLYFGGGSPALAVDYLPRIMEAVKQHYGQPESLGIELHPRDMEQSTLEKLKNLGINMVSLGAQSFDPGSLKELGRSGMSAEDGFSRVRNMGFEIIDVDLIFAVPGQNRESLERDFRKAVELGATQVSTYPFIRFSYTGQHYPSPSRRKQRQLLNQLNSTAEETEFCRTSVWTFGKKDKGKYSSVTRNNVLGFGASATSLFRERFALNAFSVEEYCRSLNKGKSPQVLELQFSSRVRKMYWLFWSSYNLRISETEFRRFFGKSPLEEFPFALRVGLLAGLLRSDGEDLCLTDRGALLFHRVEQVYTHQYIDKTWRICGSNPRPDRINLF